MDDKPSTKYLEDKDSFNAIIDRMDIQWKDTYKEYKALSMESAFPGRKMIVYTLNRGVPTDVMTIVFGSMVATPEDGPMVDVSGGGWSTVLTVSPMKWRDRDFFLHMPQNFIFKWKGKYSPNGAIQFAPHYAVLMKTKSAEHLQIEGHTYCVALNRFKERFPEIPIRY